MSTTHDLTATQLRGAVAALLGEGHRVALVAGHEDDDCLRVVYVLVRAADDARVELTIRVPKDRPVVPSLADLDYGIGRFERELHDLYGITPEGHPLPARLVRHAHWPSGWYPMRRDAGPAPAFEPDVGSFPFVEVEGDGVYEIPVGPVHAGLIEPGHFRFSVVGETILRMKARLWFVHRGVEKLFEGQPVQDGIALAELISGDTAVGHAIAYAVAVEGALGIEIAEQDRLIRAVLLELERLHNHVADLGALANDVGYGIANAHAQTIRESLLRLNKQVTGHRLLRGGISVGGAHVLDLPPAAEITSVAHRVAEVVDICLSNSTVLDRFTGTAVLPGEQARGLGVLGYVARASGIDVDARRDHPIADLPGLEVVVEHGGDVLARYLVRAREVQASAHLLTDLLLRLAGETGSGSVRRATGGRAGIGLAGGWRGTIAHRVEIGTDGRISRVKVVDPSFFNWPALPVALADTIVPDFPLANKSFNQSYAGNDL
ncbi:NADH-quinone oxidoreductase subunit C [Nocardioides agariphilus]|uniref:NADH-quinone oxidoreductase subunit C n=1 Tax=Nocardioides agariphilus TaxID=433664 RepID=A0A930YGS6_9ACTN|nr:NADH-quinone oxidoreductase subunit C [Nocardioides agariphilus]MBF4766243.1 NADH-quinone oxidoreductase subunit C [Nocardioides agariphilus]